MRLFGSQPDGLGEVLRGQFGLTQTQAQLPAILVCLPQSRALPDGPGEHGDGAIAMPFAGESLRLIEQDGGVGPRLVTALAEAEIEAGDRQQASELTRAGEFPIAKDEAAGDRKAREHEGQRPRGPAPLAMLHASSIKPGAEEGSPPRE